MAFVEDPSWIKDLEDRGTRTEPYDDSMWFRITSDGTSWKSVGSPDQGNYYGAEPTRGADGTFSHLIGQTAGAPVFAGEVPRQIFDAKGQPNILYKYADDSSMWFRITPDGTSWHSVSGPSEGNYYGAEPTRGDDGTFSHLIGQVAATTWGANPKYGTPGGVGSTTPGAGGTGGTGTGTGTDDAFAIVDDLVRSYGLDKSIADFIKGQMRTAQSRTAIAMKIRQQPAYHLRFPAMKARIDAGLPALTENEYMALETDYRSAMQAADLPENFSDSPDDFAALIAGDVSVAEVQSRVALAEQSLDQANQDTITQLQTWYDLPKGSLVAYFLDPDAAKNVFEQNRRMEAAGLSAGAMRAIGPSSPLAKGTAERLQREGVAQSQLIQRLSERRGLTTELLVGEALTADTLALGDFGVSGEAAARVRRGAAGRAAAFQGEGGALTTQRGVTGLGAAE